MSAQASRARAGLSAGTVEKEWEIRERERERERERSNKIDNIYAVALCLLLMAASPFHT